jgi:DNA polymerase-3 subunit delta'
MAGLKTKGPASSQHLSPALKKRLEVSLWQELEGHQLTLQPLMSAATEKRLAGTMLFAGPSGIGKKFGALTLAQALVCETPLTTRPSAAGCGVCGPCQRIEKNQSESLMIVEPAGAQIKIEQARDVLQFLNLQKLGKARVIIIDQAHLLGAQAGNALLKALEEPPEGTYFILVSALPNSILATLRSRSQLVRFKPLSDDSLKIILERLSQSETKIDDWLLRAANGSVESAKRMAEERAEYETLEDATTAYLAAAITHFPGDEISQLRELLKDRASHGFVASVIQGAMTDAMKLKSGLKPNLKPRMRPKSLLGVDGGVLKTVLTPLSEKDSRRLDLLARKSIEFEADLARNVDRGLLLEALAIELSR